MLETVLSERKAIEKLKTKSSRSRKGNKLGKCLICGERVRTSHDYLTTSEGYTHKNCLKEWRGN
ncbi:MAG: hypothetical protein SVV03_01290 [Candidatus Nanohaloarchaea archaeon]|nr:hypothetical protein [Candidatus Nanohaloarchaea archaeon]